MSTGTITIKQGDDTTIDLAFKNLNGSAFNLTGSTVTFAIRRNATATPVITRTITSFTNAAAGLTTISLSHTETALAVRAWRYEIVLTDTNGLVRSSGLNYFVVTETGTATNAVSVSVGSATISVALTMTQVAAIAVSSVAGRTGDVVL